MSDEVSFGFSEKVTEWVTAVGEKFTTECVGTESRKIAGGVLDLGGSVFLGSGGAILVAGWNSLP